VASTKIVVFGAGAIGSVYAAVLAADDHDVWAVRRSPEFVDAVARHGLRVEGPDRRWSVRVSATTDAADVGECDLAVLATKAYQVRDALPAMRPLVGPHTTLLAMQNGLGSAEQVAAAFGADRLIVGVAEAFGASERSPGHVQYHATRRVRLGARGRPAARALLAVADLWMRAGFPVSVDDDIDRLVWEKLVCNVAFGGVTALTGYTIGRVMGDPHAWLAALRCAREAHAVGQARGVEFTFADVDAHVAAFGSTIPHARTSMLQDVLAGRPCEVDAIHGSIVRIGAEVGASTPWNTAVARRVKAKEQRRR
jgi:2-dehydropantoate 2-reductase